MGKGDLTEEQWQLLSRLLPPLPRRKDGRGRPWKDTRAVLNGILWVLRTGAQWHALPKHYPPYQTCHRRFQQWVQQGVWQELVRTLARQMQQAGQLELAEAFIDAMFAPAKKGARRWAKPRVEKAAK